MKVTRRCPRRVVATARARLEFRTFLPLFLWMVCFPIVLEALSSTTISPPTKTLNRKARQAALNSIWHYTNNKSPIDAQRPDKALKWLETLLLDEQIPDSHKVLKHGVVWNVLRACCQSAALQDMTTVERLLDTHTLLQQNPRLYHVNMTSMVFTALEESGHSKQARALLDTILIDSTNSLLELSDWNETFAAKNAMWFHLFKNADKQGGAEKALLLLMRLLEYGDNCGVDRSMVISVLRSGARGGQDLERLHGLLERRGLLDAKMLTQVLSAITSSHDKSAMARAERILSKETTFAKNTYHYCALLNGYAQRGNAKKAERLFQSMIDDGVKVNTIVCNCVLNAFANSNSAGKMIERSEALLKRMRKEDSGMRPDNVSYQIMLNLYSKHGMGNKAESLLNQMIQLKESGKLKQEPSAFAYRCVVDSLAKSGRPDKAETLLSRMRSRGVDPNIYHYCGVLNGYAREGQSSEAERLLQSMAEHSVSPNVVAYNCVMYAYAKTGEVDAPFRIRDILDRMADHGVAPDLISYNCLLKACANRGMAKECEQLLKQMHQQHEKGELDEAPNVISYNYVLDSLARSGDRVWTVMRAESLVHRMQELYADHQAKTKPNRFTFQSLLKCYITWSLPEDAERLLVRMQKLYETSKLDQRPDRASYLQVIDALRKSDDRDIHKRADDLEQQMLKIYGRKAGWRQEQSLLDEGDQQLDALLEYMSS